MGEKSAKRAEHLELSANFDQDADCLVECSQGFLSRYPPHLPNHTGTKTEPETEKNKRKTHHNGITNTTQNQKTKNTEETH